MKRRFKQVDVFTARPYYGNPVAVVIDASDLSTATMQRIARWTNLSETTFLLPPTRAGADYRLRIFTPAAELPFAGHPTVGSAHAAIEAGVVATKPTLVQECAAGLLGLAVEAAPEGRRIFVTAPPVRFKPLVPERVAALTAALGAPPITPPEIADVGPIWLVAQLADAATVEALRPDQAAIAALSDALGITGITVFGATGVATLDGTDDAIAVRSFAPLHGVPEDPVCGSGNISVAAFLERTRALPGLLPRYSASQGRPIGRDGHVAVRIDPSRHTVQVGGHAVTCIDGMLDA